MARLSARLTGTSAPAQAVGKRSRAADPGAASAAQGERELLECAALPVEGVLARLGTSDKGLSPEQVEERLERFGPNEVEHARKQGFLGEILERSKNPLVV